MTIRGTTGAGDKDLSLFRNHAESAMPQIAFGPIRRWRWPLNDAATSRFLVVTHWWGANCGGELIWSSSDWTGVALFGIQNRQIY